MSRRLSPIDIEHAEFSRSLNGYDRKEVRAFLERLSVEVEAGLREAQALRQRVETAEARIAEMKDAEAELQRAVVGAERMAVEMKEVARREAELLLQEARRASEARQAEAEQGLRRAQAALSRLQHEKALFREQFRGLLQAYLKGLDAVPDAAQDAPASSALLDDSVQT